MIRKPPSGRSASHEPPIVRIGVALRYVALLAGLFELLAGITTARLTGVAVGGLASLGGDGSGADALASTWAMLGVLASTAFHVGVLFALGEILVWLGSRTNSTS